MTTTWARTPGGTISITFRPGLVFRLIGLGFLGVGLYFLWQIGGWLIDVVRAGGGGVGMGDFVGLLVMLVMAAAFEVPGAMLAFFGASKPN